jgi:hypothetical protein
MDRSVEEEHKERQKGSANRATLAVARKLIGQASEFPRGFVAITKAR